MNYLVALGAPTSLAGLRRAYAEIQADIEVWPATDKNLRAAFPTTDNVVFVRVRAAAEGGGAPIEASDGLVSRRHTATAALRQLVWRAATDFGAVRLLVQARVGGGGGAATRQQTSTLASFLRSGRVVPEDVLLTILPASHRRPLPRARRRSLSTLP